jgi:hypothetical protein
MLRDYFFFPDFFLAAFFFATVPHLHSWLGRLDRRARARDANFRVDPRAELIDALHCLGCQPRDLRRAVALQLSFSNCQRAQRKHENNLFAKMRARSKRSGAGIFHARANF